MKIYFTGQLYKKADYIKEYEKIIKVIKSKGHKILQDTMEYNAEQVLNQNDTTLQKYYKKYFNFLKEMDCCVAEISFPSTVNIGFDVANIISRGKPVIALYRKGEDPKFISPEYSQKMIKIEYTLDTIDEVLEWALLEVEQKLNRRFTFFINSDIDKYLDVVCKNKNTNKSDYLRNLVYKDMKKI